MKLEMDHIYICVKKNAPEIKILQDAGLVVESDITYHTGQRTASVFINFVNIYLEFIWIENLDDLRRADHDLVEKFEHSLGGCSPFGLGLHRCDLSDDSLSFRTNSYYSEWMKPETSIEVVKNNNFNDPFIFVVPRYMNWKSAVSKYSKLYESIKHQAELKVLTNILLKIPQMHCESEEIKELRKQNILEFKFGNEHYLELIFDDFKNNKIIDAYPELPINIKY